MTAANAEAQPRAEGASAGATCYVALAVTPAFVFSLSLKQLRAKC